MPVTFDSLADVKANVQSYIRGQLTGWGMGSTQFLGKLAAICTLAVYSFLKTARQIDRDAIPNANTSSQGLQDWGNGLGLPVKAATAATGGVGVFTGAAGTLYPINSTLSASDGVTKFLLVAGVTIPGGGSATGTIIATTGGALGNQAIGSTLTVDSVPAGGVANVVLTTGTTGGIDLEQNSSWLARIQARISNPPKAVTGPDLRSFAEGTVVGSVASPTAPAYRAFVYPLRSGSGTADVVITKAPDYIGGVATSLTSRKPASVAIVDAVLQSDRTVTAAVNTLLPSMPVGNALAIVVRATPPDPIGQKFDWTSALGGLTVAAYNSAGPTLTLSGAPPADFVTAYGAGNKPRLQINPTGSLSPLPQQVQVVGYNAGTLVCTLANAFADPPLVGDAVNAGGVIVSTVALAIQKLVDGLGPSRVSGYADPNDATGWDDTLRIDQIRKVALNAVDATSGKPLVLSFPVAPTIAVGAGAAASVDRQAPDATPGTAPELLYAKSIAVLP